MRVYLISVLLLNIVWCEDMTYTGPSIFVNHGGGPLPVLGDKVELEVAEGMKNMSNYIDWHRVKAIIIVTAHREENIVTISSGPRHSLLYDYYRFPPVSYTFKYNAPGDPTLAAKIQKAFENVGIPSKLDDERGWDHGVFIPMMLIRPTADVPIVQISILKNHDAKQHYEIGKVLYPFRKDGVVIIGSGMSYHNMAEFRSKKKNDGIVVNYGFDDFLNEVCTGDVDQRENILGWEKVPRAFESHPRGEEDHLMPLIVNAGAGGSQPGKNIFEIIYDSRFKLSGFLWDEE